MEGHIGIVGEVSSCNVAGLTNLKIRHFKNVLKTSDIACLQETHGKRKDSASRVARLGFEKGVFSLFNNAARGAAVLWKSPYVQVGKEWLDPEGRLAAVVLKDDKGNKTLVASVYAPNVDSSRHMQSDYVSFMITLEFALSELIMSEQPDRMMILGDFNVICDAEVDSRSVAPKVYPIPLEALREVLGKYELFDAYRSLYPDITAFTFSRQGLLNRDGSRAPPIMNRLDYAFLDATTLSEVKECEHIVAGMTDHKLVKLQIGPEKRKKLLGLWKHNDTLNKDQNFVKLMKENLIAFIPEAEKDCKSARGAWEAIKGKVREWSRKYSIAKMKEERLEKRRLVERLEINPDFLTEMEKNQFFQDKQKLDEIHKRELQRIIFRAKVRSLQKDEKYSKIFHMQIRQNRNMSNVTQVVEEDRVIRDPKEVNGALREFYANLYTSVNPPPTPPDQNWFESVKKLPEGVADALDRPLAANEISTVLFKHSKTGKSPGNDGITVEFYRTFWQELRDPLIKALREALLEGELSPSQKQSVIRLIPKKGRDMSKIKNWRPISLMNVDAKLLSKALNIRLEKHIDHLISKEQAAFIKGKLLQDNANTLKQAIAYAEKKKHVAYIFSVDFKKAFDQLEHTFLWRVMREMGFGGKFIEMIQTLYKNAESTVINGGVTTKYFPLQRAARQGDPISPTLFILALEPLLGVLRKEVKGISTPKGCFKLSAYADDVAIGLGEEDDIRNIVKILKDFGEVSGLTINEDKCELMGVNSREKTKHIFQINDNIKITGVVFGNSKNGKQTEKMNFEPAVKAIEKQLLLWKSRILTIDEKVLVVKSYALSQLQFLAGILPTPDWVINEVNNLITSFLSPCKIAKLKASRSCKQGGLALPQIKNVCTVAFIKTLTRASMMGDSELWSANIIFELEKIGMEAALHPQTSIARFKRLDTPNFICSLIGAWQLIQKEMNPEWSKEITGDSPICYNLKILGPGLTKGRVKTTLDTPHLRRQGINTIKHFFNEAGEERTVAQAKNLGLKSIAQIEWQKVGKALKLQKIQVRGQTGDPRNWNNKQFWPRFKTTNGNLEGEDLTQKKILREIAKNTEYIPNETQRKVAEILELEEEDLIRAFSRIRIDHRSGQMHEFQFKLLSGIVFTNKAYKVMKKKQSAKCTFCNEEQQSFTHLYISCEGVNNFRTSIADSWEGAKMTKRRWFLGCSSESDDLERSKDFIAKEINHYIFQMNWLGADISKAAFHNRIMSVEEVEEAVASNTGKIFDFQVKWELLKTLLK